MTRLDFCDKHNMVAYLEKSAGSEGFEQIIDFLSASHIHFALTANLTIYTSLIQQFWETAALCTMEDGVPGISATIDRKVKVLVSKASIRIHLKLEDSEGISSLLNAEIFEQLANMGYVTDSESLTFQKGHFSPQWKFFIHTILHCLSPKKTAWDQFSSNLATAIICLATKRIFNFSKFLFEAMVKNIDSQHKFLMYPRFIQIFVNKHQRLLLPHKTIYPTPTLKHKLFNNMKRVSKGYSGVVTPLFDTMIAQGQSQSSTPQTSPSRITSSLSLSLQTHQPSPSPHPIDTTHHTEEPTQMPYESPLHKKVASLESELKQTKETYSTALIKLILRVKKLEKQVQTTNSRRKTRIILSKDEDATGDPSNQGRIIEEIKSSNGGVSTASRILSTAGVSTANESDSTAGGKAKDKGKEIMQEPEPPKKHKKRVQVQMSMDEEIAKNMFEEEQAKLDAREEVPAKATQATQAHEIDWNDPSVLNKIVEQNMENYKMSYFKGMSYDQIRPILEEEYKKVSNITEAYQIFEDMLKAFDREDLDTLWSLVKEKFRSVEPTEDMERALWVELKRLYEPDKEDTLWKLQRYMHDPLTWRLYGSCAVHHVFSTRGHCIYMLPEKDYPLTTEVMMLMLSRRLQVEEDSEMARDLVKKIFIEANRSRR
ncbi:hypothetical protein Tco_0502040 [Tanacetum coccineum]